MRLLLAAVTLLAAGPALAQTQPTSTTVPAAEVGSLIGPALNVRDLDASLRFYVDGLGMTNVHQRGPATHLETILLFGSDPMKAGIVLLSTDKPTSTRPAQGPTAFDHTIVRLKDLEATAARLKAVGFTPSAITDVGQGYRKMTATDPDGIEYELVQSPARPEQPR